VRKMERGGGERRERRERRAGGAGGRGGQERRRERRGPYFALFSLRKSIRGVCTT